MVPETPVASIVSPSAALARQPRSVPSPLSAVLVTVQVVASVGIAAAKSSAVAMATDLMAGMNWFFIFIMDVQSKSPDFWRETDIYFGFLAEYRLAWPAGGSLTFLKSAA